MEAKGSIPFYLSVQRSLPVLVSGRGVRLISSATVKGRGQDRGEGVQTFEGSVSANDIPHATSR